MRFGPAFATAVKIIDGDPVLDVVEARVEMDLLKTRPLVEGVAALAHHFRIPGRAGDMVEQARTWNELLHLAEGMVEADRAHPRRRQDDPDLRVGREQALEHRH